MKQFRSFLLLGTLIAACTLWLPIAAWPCITGGTDDKDNSNQKKNQDADKCTDCETSSETAIDSGSLSEDHTIASYRSLGQTRVLRLVYSSLKADPQPTVSIIVNIVDEPGVQMISSRLEVPGVFHGEEVFTDLRGLNLQEPQHVRQVAQFDASALETGLHPYSLTTVVHAPGSDTDGRTIVVDNSVLVVNQRSSPFGAGWTLDGIGSLVTLNNGNVLLVEGDGSARFFDRKANTGRFFSPVGDFSSLVQNRDGSYTRTLKDGTELHFDAEGRQVDAVDRNANTTRYGYNAEGLLTSITDPVGFVTTLTYDNGLLASIVDQAGRETKFTHEDRNLVRIIDPDGSQREFTYDSRHRLISQISKRGFISTYEYNFAGRNVRAVRPDGSAVMISPSQTLGLVNLQSGQGTIDNPAPPVIARDIHAQFFDAKGNATRFEANEFGTATVVFDALGGRTISDTDDAGLPTRIERPNGTGIQLTYDERGNVIKRTEARTDRTRAFLYERQFNQVIRSTDPNGNVTGFEYDERGNLVKIVDVLNRRRILGYESRGLVTSIADPLGNITRLDYDTRGNLVKATDPLGNATVLAYDAAGNVLSSTDAKGNTTHFAYDPMNRLIQVTEPGPQGGVTSYEYDEASNLTKITNAIGHVVRFQYDRRDRLVETVDPIGNKEEVAYDGNGNVVSIFNRKRETITFEYDALNRLVKKTLPGNEITSFGYDEVGILTSVDDPDSRLALMYDAENRLIGVSTAGSPSQPPVTIGYSYDRNGNRLRVSDGMTGVTKYLFDALDQVRAIKNPAKQRIRFTYDEGGRRMRILRPRQLNTRFVYDGANQVTKLQHTLGGEILSRFGYRYDPLGNRTGLNVTRKNLGVTGSLRYTYDPLERLTRATRPLRGQPDEVFVYDGVGNRLQRDDQASPSVFDAANRLLEDQSFRYVYDVNGNLIEKVEKGTSTTTVYTYDAENRLVRIDFPNGKVATYRYDGLGRRIEKNVDGVITRYVYDQEDILLEFDGVNTLLARYTHGGGVDEPLIMERDLDKDGALERNERFFYRTDALGSVTELTDASGKVAQSYVYDAFGQLVRQVGSRPNPYTYTGREFDAESDLYYYRARYYDPRIGRFNQEDPFRGVLTQPSTLNLYAYVGNNPINRQDPFGLQGSVTVLDFTNDEPLIITGNTEPGLIREDPIMTMLVFVVPVVREADVLAAAGMAMVQAVGDRVVEFCRGLTF